jgi:hypothetical protein
VSSRKQTLVYGTSGEGQYPLTSEDGEVITAQSEIKAPVNAIDQLTADDFAGYLGGKVWPGPGLEMVLDRIDRPEFPGWERIARKPFSLIFRGPRQPLLPEGLYPVEFADGPTLVLYVIPILTTARDHQEYQVVFN